MNSPKLPAHRRSDGPPRNPITPALKQEINRIAHFQMQRLFYDIRRQLEQRARDLLRDGMSELDVMSSLRTDPPSDANHPA